jgi:cytochrome P450
VLRIESVVNNTCSVTPFSGGPRICMGQNFALNEMGYTVVRILQHFDRVECRMSGPPSMKANIALEPR